MDENNVRLFKQAISEGLNNKIQKTIDSCTENIIPSRRHRRAMAALLRQNKEVGSVLTPKMRRVIAVLVAAALLLVSCAIVYRNEIRGFIENIYESFIKVGYIDGDGQTSEAEIQEYYELTYLPKDYYLESNIRMKSIAKSEFLNENNRIVFEQCVLDISDFYLDVENGFTKMPGIENNEVYYRRTAEHSYYLWNDGKYSMRLIVDFDLPMEELQQIIDGVKTQ